MIDWIVSCQMQCLHIIQDRDGFNHAAQTVWYKHHKVCIFSSKCRTRSLYARDMKVIKVDGSDSFTQYCSFTSLKCDTTSDCQIPAWAV